MAAMYANNPTRRAAAALAGAVVVVLVALAVVALVVGEEPAGVEAAAGCATDGAVPEAAANPGLVADCEALLALRAELAGTSSALNWSTERELRYWTGVRIRGTPPRVTELRVLGRRLSGQVPAGLAKLTELVYLDLRANELSGSIPPELGQLPRLQVLRLWRNKLSGTVPAALASAPLQSLYLGRNALTGCVPAALLDVRQHDLGTLRLPTCTGTPTTPTTPATPTATATPAPVTATYTLTLTQPPNGGLSARPAGASHAAGTRVLVTAAAHDGYRLTAWGGDCAGTAATSAHCTLVMNADKTASATFGKAAAATYTLTLTQPSNGSLSARPAGASHAAGTRVVVTAAAAAGYALTAWGGDCAGTATSASCALVMDANKTAAGTYTLALTQSPNGSLTTRPAGASHAAGTNVLVTAVAHDGYVLTAWGGDCAGRSATSRHCVLTMNANRAASATFGKAPTPIGQQPAPELITVTTGKAGEILLEWRIGHDPEGVTGWQYRQRARQGGTTDGPWAWGAWTDVPGSNAATRSYRLTGQPRRVYHFEVRAVAGRQKGSASPSAEGRPAIIGADGIPLMLADQIVEGGRTWRVAGGPTVIDVPAGTRLVGGRGWYSDGVVSVGFRDVATDSWQIVDIDRAQGLGRVIVAPPGVAADAVVGGGAQDGASRDVGAIFDQIMGSARLVPVK